MLLGLYGHVGKKLALTTTFPLEVDTLFSSMQKMLFVCDQSSLFPPSFFSLKKLDETNRCPSMINISLPPHRSWCRQTFWHHFAYKQVLTLHKCHGNRAGTREFPGISRKFSVPLGPGNFFDFPGNFGKFLCTVTDKFFDFTQFWKFFFGLRIKLCCQKWL